MLVFDVHLLKVERPGEGTETLDEKFEGNGGTSDEKKLVVSNLCFYSLVSPVLMLTVIDDVSAQIESLFRIVYSR